MRAAVPRNQGTGDVSHHVRAAVPRNQGRGTFAITCGLPYRATKVRGTFAITCGLPYRANQGDVLAACRQEVLARRSERRKPKRRVALVSRSVGAGLSHG